METYEKSCSRKYFSLHCSPCGDRLRKIEANSQLYETVLWSNAYVCLQCLFSFKRILIDLSCYDCITSVVYGAN